MCFRVLTRVSERELFPLKCSFLGSYRKIESDHESLCIARPINDLINVSRAVIVLVTSYRTSSTPRRSDYV